MTNKLINSNTKTITFSLPPEMAEQVQDLMRDERRTMSELIREAPRSLQMSREKMRSHRLSNLGPLVDYTDGRLPDGLDDRVVLLRELRERAYSGGIGA